MQLDGNEYFADTPFFPDLRGAENEEGGDHSPILPMDSITTFFPDEREEVTVTYRVTMRVRVDMSDVPDYIGGGDGGR